MVLMCQHDSYLKSFNTVVVSCVAGECKITNDCESNTTVQGFFVELEDTVLFPEGGGQPDDHGTINNVPVKRVVRKGAKALHFVEEKISEGKNVRVVVDWKRRFDHMQQHSAQHLITAIADKEFGFQTTSWNLGRSVSSIEMDISEVSPLQLEKIQNLANEAIRNSVPVKVHVTHVGSPFLEGVRSRGLPEDHHGDVRVIEITNIETNMCCGTHVSNLAHLQIVKLLSTEKVKKDKTNLFYIAGKRVLDQTEKFYLNERKLTKLLKCSSDKHVAMVEKSVTQLKILQKSNTNLLRRLAILEAFNFRNQSNERKLMHLHQKDGTVEFMNIIANEVGENLCLFITIGDEKGSGMFILSGPSSFISNCAGPVANTIEGKGFVKNKRMQGKAIKLQKRQEAIAICNNYLSSL